MSISIICFTLFGFLTFSLSLIWFYWNASSRIIYWDKKISQPPKGLLRILITGGIIENVIYRLNAIEDFKLPEKSILQINLDRRKSSILKKHPLSHKYETNWNHINPYGGTASELQEALTTALKNKEILLVPLIPEQSLKLYLIRGDTTIIRVLPLKASPPRRFIEFLKSYAGWVAPGLVNKFRPTYYEIESWAR